MEKPFETSNTEKWTAQRITYIKAIIIIHKILASTAQKR